MLQSILSDCEVEQFDLNYDFGFNVVAGEDEETEEHDEFPPAPLMSGSRTSEPETRLSITDVYFDNLGIVEPAHERISNLSLSEPTCEGFRTESIDSSRDTTKGVIMWNPLNDSWRIVQGEIQGLTAQPIHRVQEKKYFPTHLILSELQVLDVSRQSLTIDDSTIPPISELQDDKKRKELVELTLDLDFTIPTGLPPVDIHFHSVSRIPRCCDVCTWADVINEAKIFKHNCSSPQQRVHHIGTVSSSKWQRSTVFRGKTSLIFEILNCADPVVLALTETDNPAAPLFTPVISYRKNRGDGLPESCIFKFLQHSEISNNNPQALDAIQISSVMSTIMETCRPGIKPIEASVLLSDHSEDQIACPTRNWGLIPTAIRIFYWFEPLMKQPYKNKRLHDDWNKDGIPPWSSPAQSKGKYSFRR